MTRNGGRSIFSRVLDVFRVEGKWCWPIVIAFAIIQLIVLYNAIAHDPRFGYDAPGHIAYVRTLAEGRLPTPTDTHEFFSPPLPYVPAALAWRLLDGPSSDGRQILALKVAQLAQWIASFVVCWSILAIAQLIRHDRAIRIGALVGIGIIPAYYRTFAMVRGEPMMVALLLLGMYLALRAYAITRPDIRKALGIGLLLGGSILCRQWAFFALPAIALAGLWRLIVDANERKATMISGLVLLTTAALSGGWYYAHLHHQHGSIRAFNRAPDEGEAIDVPAKRTDELLIAMISAPVRHAFDNHPVWLFYADTWGDYWRYFLTYARDGKGRLVKAVLIDRAIDSGKSKGSNVATMPAYLGRACAASVLPSVLMIAGLACGLARCRRWPTRTEQGALLVLPTVSIAVVTTLIGYGWFVCTYPNVHLDTVKASYPIQIFPLLAIATAAMWCAVRERWPGVAIGLAVCVLAFFVHNLGTVFTRYTVF